MRFLKILGLAIAGVAGLLAVGAVAFVIAAERGWLNGQIESMASSALGRQVEIEGGIDIDLGTDTGLALGPLRIANPDWAPDPTMAEIQRVELVVRLPALLRGDIVVPRVLVDRPRADLLRLADGRANWQFGEPQPDQPAAADSPTQSGPPSLPEIQDLEIRGLHVGWRDEGSGADTALEMPELGGQLGGDLPTRLAGAGTLAGQPLQLAVDSGPLTGLDGAGEPVPFEVGLDVADTRLRAEGRLASLDQLSSLAADAALVTGPSTPALLAALGIPVEPLPPIQAKAEVRPAGNLSAIRAEVDSAGQKLRAEGTVANIASPLDGLDLTAALGGDDLSQVLALLGREPAGDVPPYLVAATVSASGNALEVRELGLRLGENWAQGRARLADLGRPDQLSFALEGGAPALTPVLAAFGLGEPELPPFTFATEGVREGQGLRVDVLDLQLGENRIQGRGTVADLGTLDGIEAHLEADLPRLTAIARSFELTDRVIPDFTLTADATRQGEANEVRLEARFGEDIIRLFANNEGPFTELDNLRLQAAAEGTDLGQFLPLLGLTEQPVPSYRLNADVGREADGGTRLDIAAALGTTEFTAAGRIGDLATVSPIEIDFTARGESPARLLAIFGLPQIDVPPYNVAGHLTRDGDVLRVSDLDGSMGDSDLRGTAAVDLAPQPVDISADLFSDRLDFDDLAGIIGAPPDPTETASPEQREQAAALEADNRFIPDTEFDTEAWGRINADIRFEGREVLAPNLPIENLSGHLVLRDRRLVIEPGRADVAGGRVEMTADLDGSGGPVDGDFDINIEGLQLRDFLVRFGVADYGFGILNGRVQIAGRGQTLRELAGNADGRVAMVMEGGQIDAVLFEAAGLDITETLGVLFFDNDEDPGEEKVELRCFLADFDVEDGVMRSRTVLIDWPDEKITVDGSIALGTETLDLMVHAIPRDASIGSARMPISVEGPIRSPTISPAPGEVENPVLGWALAPFAAFLPFVELGTEDDQPCRGVAGDVRDRAGSPG